MTGLFYVNYKYEQLCLHKLHVKQWDVQVVQNQQHYMWNTLFTVCTIIAICRCYGMAIYWVDIPLSPLPHPTCQSQSWSGETSCYFDSDAACKLCTSSSKLQRNPLETCGSSVHKWSDCTSNSSSRKSWSLYREFSVRVLLEIPIKTWWYKMETSK